MRFLTLTLVSLALSMPMSSTVGAVESPAATKPPTAAPGKPGEAPALPVILVTAYKAFAGRGVNGSETVATALDGQIIAGHRIATLVMPVRWGEPERSVPNAVAQRHPTMVLGLGEGYPGKVTVEFTARNKAEYPDEEKKLPPSVELLKDGPVTRAARFTFDAAWFTGSKIPVLRSDDAGAYLCNDCLYVGLGTEVPIVGFVHLPPQGDVTSEDYRALLVPIVTEIVTRNAAAKPAVPVKAPASAKP